MKTKEYNKYKRRILAFAKKEGVEISFSTDKNGEFNYYQHKRKNKKPLIVVKRNQLNEMKIAVLLHELGHYLDYKKDKHRWLVNKKAYNSAAFLSWSPLKESHKFLIYETEKRAWKEAVVLAKSLNIDTGYWLSSFKERTLFSYKNWPVLDD